jgi:hypothetical protein
MIKGLIGFFKHHGNLSNPRNLRFRPSIAKAMEGRQKCFLKLPHGLISERAPARGAPTKKWHAGRTPGDGVVDKPVAEWPRSGCIEATEECDTYPFDTPPDGGTQGTA